MPSRRTAGAKARAASPLSTPSKPLSNTDRLFLSEYFRNGLNATQAYLAVRPGVKYTSAESLACVLLKKPQVVAEVERRLRYEHGVSKDALERDLMQCRDWAFEAKDYQAGASIIIDQAKLAGFLVEKKQDVTPTPSLTEAQLADELKRRGYVSVPAN